MLLDNSDHDSIDVDQRRYAKALQETFNASEAALRAAHETTRLEIAIWKASRYSGRCNAAVASKYGLSDDKGYRVIRTIFTRIDHPFASEFVRLADVELIDSIESRVKHHHQELIIHIDLARAILSAAGRLEVSQTGHRGRHRT